MDKVPTLDEDKLKRRENDQPREVVNHFDNIIEKIRTIAVHCRHYQITDERNPLGEEEAKTIAEYAITPRMEKVKMMKKFINDIDSNTLKNYEDIAGCVWASWTTWVHLVNTWQDEPADLEETKDSDLTNFLTYTHLAQRFDSILDFFGNVERTEDAIKKDEGVVEIVDDEDDGEDL